MRKFKTLLFGLAVSLCAETTVPVKAVERATEEVERLKPLVEAGALPKVRLEKAQQELVEAQDDLILQQTLYAKGQVGDLSEEQIAGMTQAAQRKFDRQQLKVDQHKELIEAGVLARITLTPLLEELDMRRREVDLARSHARLASELAVMARAEEALMEDDGNPTPSAIYSVAFRFHGDGTFDPSDFLQVSNAYESRFSRKLPVSAMGMTATHRALGFDHRGRVDVALSPDQEEGRWLRGYLEQHKMPYFAFRAAIPGKATAPHIHLGPPSNRLRSAD